MVIIFSPSAEVLKESIDSRDHAAANGDMV